MTNEEFMAATRDTAIYPKDQALLYCVIGLADEAGEALGKMKKFVRGDRSYTETSTLVLEELGDVFWYAFRICDELGVDPSEVMKYTAAKLADRKERGVIRGDGDHR